MSELTLSSFYPNNYICCHNDLNFDDGTYEVLERNVILNIFIIENHRIQYHIKYNTSLNKRLITFKFEYLTADDGTPINNIWRQAYESEKYSLMSSSRWDLYPKEYEIITEHNKKFNDTWNKFINHMQTCAENDVTP